MSVMLVIVGSLAIISGVFNIGQYIAIREITRHKEATSLELSGAANMALVNYRKLVKAQRQVKALKDQIEKIREGDAKVIEMLLIELDRPQEANSPRWIHEL